ncbi:MAG TPA: hypothetical protein VNF50_10705 [Acidimicrobiales bacterium]|nr:hypothetical protein [Acidimicrobiales bacterium]
MPRHHVQVDIPCDVQQVDETGMPWVLLSEARDPALIVPGAIVIAADESDPVVARVADVVDSAGHQVVHLELLPGDPRDYAEALSRAHLLTA